MDQGKMFLFIGIIMILVQGLCVYVCEAYVKLHVCVCVLRFYVRLCVSCGAMYVCQCVCYVYV